MAKYNVKITNYGYKEKITIYDKGILYGTKSISANRSRQKYEDMSEAKKERSDKRRISYYRKQIYTLTEIAQMNPDLNVFITLTFKENITSYDIAVSKWQSFLKRLRNYYSEPLKYICVWEYQKKRSKKEGIKNGGIFHFHCLMNIGFIDNNILGKIWGNGFVNIQKITNKCVRRKCISYTTKYCLKGIIEYIDKHENTRRKRFFFTSNNLLKPTCILLEKDMNIEDVIFENLENMITDGSYEVKNYLDIIINIASYVVYSK